MTNLKSNDTKMIYLIRHGQTLFNLQKKILRFCDSQLTVRGIQQAQAAREQINSLNIVSDDAYCSTSERAVNTLRILTDMSYTHSKNLSDWNFGRLEGKVNISIHRFPIKIFLVQFDGECETDFQNRFSLEITQCLANSKGNHILIVSHGAAIAQFYKQ